MRSLCCRASRAFFASCVKRWLSLGIGAEELRTALHAKNDLIVDPVLPLLLPLLLPLRGVLPLVRAQGDGQASVNEIVQDHEGRLGNRYVPGDEPPWSLGAQENLWAVEVCRSLKCSSSPPAEYQYQRPSLKDPQTWLQLWWCVRGA